MTRIRFQGVGLASVALLAMACGAVDPSENTDENLSAAEGALAAAKAASPSKFFIPPPDRGAVKQIAALLKARDLVNALKVTAMVTTPQAVWLTDGSPAEIEKSVKNDLPGDLGVPLVPAWRHNRGYLIRSTRKSMKARIRVARCSCAG